MFDIGELSEAELTTLARQIEIENERRERIRVETAFINQRVRALQQIASEIGTTPYKEEAVYLPGQSVTHDGVTYRNILPQCVDTPPGVLIDPWERTRDHHEKPDGEPDEETD